MVVKILGTGCTKCKALEKKIEELKSKHALEIDIQRVSDLNDIMAYGVMMTPGLVINEKLKSVGKVPKDEQILTWLQEA